MESSTTPAKSANDAVSTITAKVRVVVRARPFLPHEITAKNADIPKPCVSVLDRSFGDRNEVFVHLKDPCSSRKECYQLDAFFGEEDDNVKRIFEKEVNPLIPGIFRGCNATVFAYGATGSGKTYTMQGTDELPGLMPLAMSTLLSTCEKTGSTAEVSYYEVYMDRCYDLLEVKAQEIVILDDHDGQTHLKGLSRVPVSSMSEFHEAFLCGVQRRKVAHTGLNDVSSRSHGVLVIVVSTPCADGSGGVVVGKMNLIDLAGNEDNRRTCNEGIRLQESAKINQSLFALSNVIYALNNNKPRVPYRESKLTRILQDSLGGSSRALMVACLNPGEYQESVHTVSLAARSRHITNNVSLTPKLETPKVKVDMEAKLQAWLESKGKTKSIQRMAATHSPLVSRTPSGLNSVKKSHRQDAAKADRTTLWNPTSRQERSVCTPARNLFSEEVTAASQLEVSLESLHIASENKQERDASTDGVVFGLAIGFPDEPLEPIEESKLSLNYEKIYKSQSPLRKALSPINSDRNTKPIEELPSSDARCPEFLEPKTPRMHLVVAAELNSQTVTTPLDKFNAWSSALKRSLVQEYIHFLNTASREELLELKGIGQKTAEYILELRETSPLTSLNDLEKIGLSSKQVHNVFRKAAGGILAKPECLTPGCP